MEVLFKDEALQFNISTYNIWNDNTKLEIRQFITPDMMQLVLAMHIDETLFYKHEKTIGTLKCLHYR
jgi:hypothetical protein